MDPTALATFAAVARRGSVSAAAQELHTVQSNVTTRLKQLEGELGVSLFLRHSRGMSLTDAGTRLLAYAQRLADLATEALSAVRDDGLVRGSLRIGSMETTAAVRLPAVLGRFHRAHPDVQLEVRTGPTAELLEHVLARRLDTALVAGPVDHPDLLAASVFREELVLVTAVDAGEPDVQLRDGGLTAVMFRQGCSYRQRLEAHFAASGWLPFRRLEFGTLEGLLGCVGAGVGVSVLPRSAVDAYRGRDDLRVSALAPKPMWVETLLVRRRDAHVGAALRAWGATIGEDDASALSLPRSKTRRQAPGTSSPSRRPATRRA
ncbi:MAG: LysR family transcriptional regulator [Rhizobacter sp.]|nr:LysR family transcriptional regulator [Rhizobacter sp.]